MFSKPQAHIWMALCPDELNTVSLQIAKASSTIFISLYVWDIIPHREETQNLM